MFLIQPSQLRCLGRQAVQLVKLKSSTSHLLNLALHSVHCSDFLSQKLSIIMTVYHFIINSDIYYIELCIAKCIGAQIPRSKQAIQATDRVIHLLISAT